MTAEELRRFLSYNPTSGEFHWLETRGGIALAGSPAGWVTQHGYRQITIKLKKYYAHRLAWLYVHGDWPSQVIDHINGDPLDNRIENLRAVDQAHNMSNISRRTNNKSGFKGVSWSKRDKTWRAYLSIKRKTVALGSFRSPEEAYEAYCVAAKEHYGECWRPA